MTRRAWSDPRAIGDWKVPFTATRQFRHLVLAGSILAAALVVLIYEIGPLISRKAPAGAPGAIAGTAARVAYSAPRRGAAEILFDGVLEEVGDGQPVDSAGEAYRHVAAALLRAPGYSPLAGEPAPPQAFLASPGSLRGETVRIEALLLRSSPLRLERPIEGREWIHRNYLVDPRADQGLVVDSLERPRAADRSLVAFDGVFLRLATYQGGKGPVQAPFFLAREVREVKQRSPEKPAGPGAVLVALAVLSVVASIFLTLKVTSRRPTDWSLAFATRRPDRPDRAAGGGAPRAPEESR